MLTKSTLGICIAFVLFANAMLYPEVKPETQCTKDKVPEIHGTQSWTVIGPHQSGPNKIEVLLPEPFDKKRHYPVVYCLPVQPGTRGQWGHPLAEAQRLGLANQHQCIYVCPSFDIWPWYGNNPANPKSCQNRHFIETVLPFIESNYPVIQSASGRYLIGFSKSGHGALSLLLTRQELWNRIAIFETWFGEPDSEQFTKWGFTECYGTRENFRTLNPMTILSTGAPAFPRSRARITVINGGPGLRLGVEMLAMMLKEKKVPYTYIANAGFEHTWTSGWLAMAAASLEINASTTPASEPAIH